MSNPSLVLTSACSLLKKRFTIIAASGGGGVAEFVTITGGVLLRERFYIAKHSLNSEGIGKLFGVHYSERKMSMRMR